MVRLDAFLRLMRPVNCLMMGFAVVVGAALVGENVFSWDALVLLFLGFFVGFFLTGASMVVNDIVDREIDAVNEPERPIPSGAVSLRQAQVFAIFLCVVGFALGMATNLESFFVAVVALLVTVIYVVWGKRTGLFGNFLVSGCVVIPFIYGTFVVGREFGEASLVCVVIVFLSNTGREVTKGIVDVEGDMQKNVRTIAVRFGSWVAAVVAAVFYVSAVVLSVLPWKLALVSFWFVPFVLICDFGLIVASILLVRDFSRENARRVKNLVLLCLVFGLFAFLAGTVG